MIVKVTGVGGEGQQPQFRMTPSDLAQIEIRSGNPPGAPLG